MSIVRTLLLILLGALLTASPLFATYRVIAYYGSWSIYGRDYHVFDMPIGQLTHVNYSFARIENGEIAHGDAYADIDRFYPGDSWNPDSLRGSYHQLILLKAAHPHLKTIISIGGWETDGFSDAALTDSTRLRFARSCASYVDRYQFDGIDIDWEFPVCCGPPGFTERPEDRANFTLFMQALRQQLDSLEQRDGREYYLTAAVAAVNASRSYDIAAVDPYLDWWNVMTYDLHGYWDDYTHFNDPLFAADGDPYGEPARTRQTADSAMRFYLGQGVAADKLILGIAYWGKGYANVANVSNGLFQPFNGLSSQGTWAAGSFDFWDLDSNYVNRNGFVRYYRPEAQAAWLYNSAQQIFICYTDSQSVAARADYIQQQQLGGAMFWMMSDDRYGELTNVLWNRLTCEAPLDLTIARQSGGGLRLNFTTRQSGQYHIWSTSDRNHDGDPNGGNDPDWQLIATVSGGSNQLLSWVDNSPSAAFRVYVITADCP